MSNQQYRPTPEQDEAEELDLELEWTGHGFAVTYGPSWTPAMRERFEAAWPGIVEDVLRGAR